MNLHPSASDSAERAADRLAVEKFAVGQSVPRKEDPMLLRGKGHYADDFSLPGQAYAVMVRSQIAHGIIRAIDTEAARKMPGVIGVYTGADLKNYGPLKCVVPFNNRDGSPMKKPLRPALPSDKVRYVGDPIAFVVAETLLAAKDAAEAVTVEIDSLPAVTSAEDATATNAPQLYDDVPGNVALDYHYGDAEAVKAAFAKAAHVTRLTLVNSRLVVNAMEPRAALAAYDGSRFTFYVGSQGVVGMRANLAEALGVTPKDVHVITGQVGGSFGMKAAVFPEYICLLHAARALGRPVKWTDDRSGSFVSDSHGRNHDLVGELALDADGDFLAVRLTSFANVGAFLSPVAPMPGTLNAVKNVQGMYRTPLIEVSTKCVFTNTSHVSAYRGAGRPEGNYYMERLIDAAAAETGKDRVALRKRNQISPRDLPYKAASGGIYDSGDFAALTKEAVELADSKGFARRKRESRKRGKLRGLGHRQFSRSDGAPVEGARRHQVQRRRHRDARDRHAGFRHGPRHAIRASAQPATRHPVRQNHDAAGRQRQTDRGRRLGRFEVDHAHRHRHRRSRGQDHREGQGAVRLRARSGALRYRIRERQFHHRRHRPCDLDHGVGG